MMPCLYHPTKVGLIDDRQEFLDILGFSLAHMNYIFEPCIDPLQALRNIKKSQAMNPLELSMTQCGDMTYDEECYTLSFDKMKDLLTTNERFNTYSVIVCDYDMPVANGLHFFRCIKDHPAKKILLTGIADEQLAIDAFNEGVIDRFIKKDDPLYLQKVSQAIDELSKEFFCSALEDMLQASSHAGSLEIPLKDVKFNHYFKCIVGKYAIAEYYLLDRLGNYVLADKSGKLYTLFVQDDAQMDDNKEHALDAPWASESPMLIEEITNKERMLCCPKRTNSMRASPGLWKEHFVKCIRVKVKDKNFYCAIREGYQGKEFLDKDLTFESFSQKI